VIEPIRDQWPGSNTDYYAVQHWAHVGNQDWGVAWTPLDTPMAEFGGLWPGYVSGAHHGVRGPGYGHTFLRAGELQRGYIYAMVSYNNFRTNFVNVHPGEYVVRYAFTSHRGDWRAGRVWQFGWNAANPPLAVWMNGPQKGSLTASTSFCHVDAANVIVLTLKQAENSDGYIVRLLETAGEETAVVISFPSLSIQHAFETNPVEENERLLTSTLHAVQTTLAPYALCTIRLGAEL
jgi:alpha-mannosidase